MRRDMSLSAVVAGLVAALVSYAGPLVVVVQAAQAARLDDRHLSSWIWAISIGSGLVGIVLTLVYRMPVLAAWSTPGAALLVTSLAGYGFGEAVAAYLVAAVLTVLVGVSGLFSALMRHIPVAVVSAMLAGILLRFGLEAFSAVPRAPAIAGTMLAAYVIARRLVPRYALVGTLATGVLAAALTGRFSTGGIPLALARPVFTAPHFTVAATVGLAVPLFLVAMASQNAPGIAVMRAAGYDPPPDRLVLTTGVASVALAPFGSPGINLAAITAAICTGPGAHEDPRKRYVAGLSCGFWYLLVGAFGATVTGVVNALPAELVATMAGIALFGALANGLSAAMREEADREAALLTFLVTGSGVTIAGLGAPFWGLVVGTTAGFLLRRRRPAAPGRTPPTEATSPGQTSPTEAPASAAAGPERHDDSRAG